MDIYRTPEERFDDLPGFPYEPRYRDWNGMRLAYVDEGPRHAPPVVMLHGEPTWSYLYRKMMGPLLDAGYRCVAPDLPGFGRSDKPTDNGWYTYARHTDAVVSLLEELDLSDATLVVQDWGGPIGFRAATLECPERIGRFVVMDTGVFTGRQRMSGEWLSFRDFVARTPDVPVGMLIERATATELPPEVISTYEAPFPDERSKAGPRTFPPLIPLEPGAPGAEEGQQVYEALYGDERPALFLWADSDPVLPLDPIGHGLVKLFPNAEGPETVENAGHFLQEDAGERIGHRIAAWLGG
jgi:haloalkane dehalogenase